MTRATQNEPGAVAGSPEPAGGILPCARHRSDGVRIHAGRQFSKRPVFDSLLPTASPSASPTSDNMSNGWRYSAVTRPSYQTQFERRKFRSRRSSAGFCLSNNSCALWTKCNNCRDAGGVDPTLHGRSCLTLCEVHRALPDGRQRVEIDYEFAELETSLPRLRLADQAQ